MNKFQWHSWFAWYPGKRRLAKKQEKDLAWQKSLDERMARHAKLMQELDRASADAWVAAAERAVRPDRIAYFGKEW